ncbi:acyl-CoA thioesterase [Thermodesulfobacteriota bacterium]
MADENKNISLISRVEVPVRFSEVDSLRVVWHGHFIKLFEDGREAFGREFGLKYMDIFNNGYFAPIVNVKCDYKAFLTYEDSAVVVTEYVDALAAKILFKYTILKAATDEVVATGESAQVFLNTDKELILTMPQFFVDWKKSNGLL